MSDESKANDGADTSPAEAAYIAATELLCAVIELVHHNQTIGAEGEMPLLGVVLSAAAELDELLTDEVLDAARGVYPPGAPGIRINGGPSEPSVLDAMNRMFGMTWVRRWAKQPRAADWCKELDLADLRTMLDREARAVLKASKPNLRPKRKKRKQPIHNDQRPLTAIENNTVEVVSRHKENFAQAAEELGRDAKTVRENWQRAMVKIAKFSGKPSRSVQASKLPSDRRGNPIV